MIRLTLYVLAYGLLGAIVGAIGVYLLAEGLAEGAIMGGILGGSVGVLVAVRRRYGTWGPAFELEAAGIHDDNLTTTARRNLVREAYRDSVTPHIFEEKIEELGSADRPKRR